MPPEIATCACALLIVALFILDRDRQSRGSRALWIPAVWLLIAGSRPLATWFQTGSSTDSAYKYNVEANPINVLAFSVLLAAGLIVLASRRQQVAVLLKANWPILFFFSYCAVSTLWSDYPAAAFRHWIRSLGDLAMVLIVLTEVEPTRALKRLLASTGFLLLPLSILLIKYYPTLGYRYSNSWNVMYTGVTDHKNTLGMTCMVCGLGLLWCFLEHYQRTGEAHRSRHLLAHGAALVMASWLLVMAHSVTSSCCFVMAGALMVVTSLSVRCRRRWSVHVLVAIVVSFSLFAVFFDPTGYLVESVGRNATLTGRTAVWDQVVDLAGNPLFGTGFESFWTGDRLQTIWDNNVGDKLNGAHNGYLEVYLNLGWCGVTLLAILVVSGYRNVLGTLRRDSELGKLKLAYFISGLVYSFTEAGFRMMSPTWIFFLFAISIIPRRRLVSSAELRKKATRHDYWALDYEGAV